MKTVKKTVHYCEFCNKKGFQAPAMLKHERHCTMNPARECGMCAAAGVVPERIATWLVLVEHLPKMTRTEFESTVRGFVNGCPACLLALVRQGKLDLVECTIDLDKSGFGEIISPFAEFDFKKESAAFFQRIRDAELDSYAERR